MRQERGQEGLCAAVCTYRKLTLSPSVTLLTAAVLLVNTHLHFCVVITLLIADSQTAHTQKPLPALIPLDTLGLASRGTVCFAFASLSVFVCVPCRLSYECEWSEWYLTVCIVFYEMSKL